MKAVSSSIFQLMMFPRDGKNVKLDSFTYYDPNGLDKPENVLPLLNSSIGCASIPYFTNVVLGIFQNTPMIGNFQDLPPPPPKVEISDICMVSSNKSMQ